MLRGEGIHVVHKSENTLRDLLCNLKDKVPPDEQTGIYQIPCQDCLAVYLGQTRRKVKVRIKEPHESAVATHKMKTDHVIDWTEAKLIKNVRKTPHLNAWESFYITTTQKPLMNEDDPPITSNLFNMTKLRIQ